MSCRSAIAIVAVIGALAGCRQLLDLDQPALRDAAVIDGNDVTADAIVDSASDARVCPPATNGCTVFTCSATSSCYYTCGTATAQKQTWAGARDSCVTGTLGCLVTINDQAEQACIAAATSPTLSTYVWIGYYQAGNTPQEPLGDWTWRCGTSTYVTPAWGQTGEPNDSGGNEDCAALTTGGAWFDANCSGTARYLCELQ